MNYIVVTPAKNEALFIEDTIKSVINQTILPVRWIIVDDGSTDDTCKIIESYVKDYKWIQLLRISNQEEIRSGGSKVVNAFYKGYYLIREDVCHDVIVKLDADLILPSDYFQKILAVLKEDPKVGLAGGVILNKIGGKLIQEGVIDYHVRGAFKAYRRICFEEIGGFKPIWNWDGLDEMEAMYNGWHTKTIDVKVIHLRPTTSAYNLRKHAYKSGLEAYRLRMNLFLVIMRGIYKFKLKPYVIYGFNYWCGYLSALISMEDRIIDKDLAHFINRFHYNRILGKIGLK